MTPVLLDWSDDAARFADRAGREHCVLAADLLAMAQDARNPRSGQRAPGFLTPRGAITGACASACGWHFDFADGTAVAVATDSLADWLAPLPVTRAMAWRGDAPPLPVFDHAAFHADPATRLQALRQVLSHGFARITGAPTEPGTVGACVEGFGPVRETNYGRTFDVRVSPDPANLADSALALLPHTDNPYRRTPPDLQVLHMIAGGGAGGETTLVDGLALVAHMRAAAPAMLDVLARVPVRWAWADATTSLVATAPVISLDDQGELLRLRVNSRSLDRPVAGDPDTRAAWWAAWHALEAWLADPAFALRFALQPGQILIMDNARVLHGRSGFDAAAGARHLEGAYADRDGLESTVRHLATAQAEAAVDTIAALFESDAMGESYGEAMSIRDHMLQSAERAVESGLDDALVAAALLHDIGWALAAPHETSGADLITPLFGRAVADPVRWHVAAKRFLVGEDPAYRAVLSQASIDTLARQGGPMSAAECAAFRAHPACAGAVALRHIDDAGKAAEAARSTFADYRALLGRLALAQALAA